MSIAVSVVLRPSRLLLAIVGCLCTGIVFAAGMIGLAGVGELPFYPRLSIAGGCLFAALSGFYCAVRQRKTFHIEISGIGQIRLMEYSGIAALSRQSEWLSGQDGGESVRLMPDSTIWPHLLLLRLQNDDNRIIVLPILRDCIAVEEFRTLLVACRWIAAQNNRPED